MLQDDIVFCLYQLPTVIISRRTDQFAKALETLLGGGGGCSPSAAPSALHSSDSLPAPASVPQSGGGVVVSSGGSSPRPRPLPAKRQRQTPVSQQLVAQQPATSASADLRQQLGLPLPPLQLTRPLLQSCGPRPLRGFSLEQLQGLQPSQQLPLPPQAALEEQQLMLGQQEILLRLRQQQQQALPPQQQALQQQMATWLPAAGRPGTSQPPPSSAPLGFQQYCQPPPALPASLPPLPPHILQALSVSGSAEAPSLQRPQPHPIGSAFKLGNGDCNGSSPLLRASSPKRRHRHHRRVASEPAAVQQQAPPQSGLWLQQVSAALQRHQPLGTQQQHDLLSTVWRENPPEQACSATQPGLAAADRSSLQDGQQEPATQQPGVGGAVLLQSGGTSGGDTPKNRCPVKIDRRHLSAE